jgi:Ca2+/Na+ antiporter
MTILNQHFSGFPGNIYDKMFRKVYEIPKFLLFYLSVIYLIRRKAYRDLFISFVVLLSFGFIILVDEAGPYRAMIFPFLYFIILYAIFDYLRNKPNKVYRYLLYCFLFCILFINSTLIFARYVVVFSNWTEMSAASIENKVSKVIPKGSVVIGDLKYYYACKKLDVDFISTYSLNPINKDSVLKKYNPQYIITSNDTTFGIEGIRKTIIKKIFKSDFIFPINLVIKKNPMFDEMYYGGAITQLY